MHDENVVENGPARFFGAMMDATIVTEGNADSRLPTTAAPRLYSVTLVERRGSRMRHVFHASLATDEFEFLNRLHGLLGPNWAEGALVRDGFDASDPLALALISAAMVDMLQQVAAAPASPLAEGLDVLVEQRFGG